MRNSYIKMTVVIWAVLTLGCATAFAGSAPGSEPPARRNRGSAARRPAAREFLQELSEKLNLTDEQKTAVKAILAGEANDIKAVHQDGSLSDEQKQAKTREIREAGREKIKALLTPEQQEKFAEIREEAGQRVREEFQNRLQMLAEQLNLTDEQKTAVKPILAAEVNDIKAVMQDNSLSREQRQSKVADIREASNTKINALLTPEQQAKLAQLKEQAKRPPRRKPARGE